MTPALAFLLAVCFILFGQCLVPVLMHAQSPRGKATAANSWVSSAPCGCLATPGSSCILSQAGNGSLPGGVDTQSMNTCMRFV